MRPVPSRTPTLLGFTPATASTNERIQTLRGLSMLAKTVGDKPLAQGWEVGVQSYADAVWGAIRVLQDAAKNERRVYTLTGYTDVPENAAPYEEAMKKILDQFNPSNEQIQKSIQKGTMGDGWVTWKPLTYLGNLLSSVPWARSGAKGDGRELDKAAKSKDALLKRIGTIRDGLGSNLARSVKVDESVKDAQARWTAEDTASASAPGPADASSTPTPGTTDTSAPSTEQAEPSAGPATRGQPAWLMPALIGTAVAGVALLLLPDGSGNRGSRARNLDYGRVASDAQEGRMLRNTLRNLETDAHAMRQMLEDDDDLPQWVHAKVQTSADRVNSAHRYLRAKIQASK